MITRRVDGERVRFTERVSGGRRPPPYESRKRRGTEVGLRAPGTGGPIGDERDRSAVVRTCGEEGSNLRG